MNEQQKVGFYLVTITNLSKLILARVQEDVKIDNISDIVTKLEYIANYLYDLEQKTGRQMFEKKYSEAFKKEFTNK